MTYEMPGAPVSSTSTESCDCVAGVLDSILYPVMESSSGLSHVRVTVVSVETARRFCGAPRGTAGSANAVWFMSVPVAGEMLLTSTGTSRILKLFVPNPPEEVTFMVYESPVK